MYKVNHTWLWVFYAQISEYHKLNIAGDSFINTNSVLMYVCLLIVCTILYNYLGVYLKFQHARCTSVSPVIDDDETNLRWTSFCE